MSTRNLIIGLFAAVAVFVLFAMVCESADKPSQEMKLSFSKGLIQWGPYTVDLQKKQMTRKGGKSYPISTDEQIGMIFKLLEMADYADISEEWYRRGGVYPQPKKPKEATQKETRM